MRNIFRCFMRYAGQIKKIFYTHTHLKEMMRRVKFSIVMLQGAGHMLSCSKEKVMLSCSKVTVISCQKLNVQNVSAPDL